MIFTSNQKRFSHFIGSDEYIIYLGELDNTIEVDHFSDRGLYINGVTIPCINNNNFIIKVNKCSLSGKGSAIGIYDFLENAHNENFMTSWINIVCEHFL